MSFGCSSVAHCEESSPFVLLYEEEKWRLCLNHVKPFEVAAARISGLVNLVFSLQTGVVECELPFVDKPILITEPPETSAQLFVLGSKLYPSNMLRMLN